MTKHIILPFLTISLAILLYINFYTLKDLVAPSINPGKFKINNFIINKAWIYSYFFIFFVLLIGWRFLNIGRVVLFDEIKNSILSMFNIWQGENFYVKILWILVSALISSNLLLILAIYSNKIKKEIEKRHIYMYFRYEAYRDLYSFLQDKCYIDERRDIISTILFIVSHNYQKIYYKQYIEDTSNISFDEWNATNKKSLLPFRLHLFLKAKPEIMTRFFYFSPFILFSLEISIKGNVFLFYYYIFIFGILASLSLLINTVAQKSVLLVYALGPFYYLNDSKYIFVVSEDLKPHLDNFILHDLSYLKIIRKLETNENSAEENANIITTVANLQMLIALSMRFEIDSNYVAPYPWEQKLNDAMEPFKEWIYEHAIKDIKQGIYVYFSKDDNLNTRIKVQDSNIWEDIYNEEGDIIAKKKYFNLKAIEDVKSK